MSNEIIMLRGRLVELERNYKQMDLEASADIASARSLIDPHVDPVTDINIDEAKVVVDRLQKTIHVMINTSQKISEIKKDLGQS